MKITQLVRTGTILATFAALQSPAIAQQPIRANETYCLESRAGRGGTVLLCRFETVAQCFSSKTAQGDRCLLNPWIAFRQRG